MSGLSALFGQKKLKKKIISSGWFDSLGTSVANKLWTDWLDNEAYN